MRTTPSVLLVGCGRMGSALASRWLRHGVISPRHLTVIDPTGAKALPKELSHIDVYKSLSSLPRNYHAGIIIFAVKPADLPALLPSYAKRFASHHPLVISIVAGAKLSLFAHHFGKDAGLIRAMPNMPALIGKGMTVAISNAYTPDISKQHAVDLLRTVGEVLWVEDESWMDAVTAVSGSGPAYVFYFIECLAAAGEAAGLPEDVARYLALLTAQGASELALLSGQPLSMLREQVASKGGTTEAALKILMREKNGLAPLMLKAVKAARKRSRELTKKQ